MSAVSHHRGVFVVLYTCLLLSPQLAFGEDNHVANRAEGYVFLDGEYLAPPYDIELQGQTILINGHDLDSSYFDFSEFEMNRASEMSRARRWQRGPGFRGGRRPKGQGRYAQVATNLTYDLQTLSAVKVFYQDQQPLTLYPAGFAPDLLSALAGEGSLESDAFARFNQSERDTWDRLVREFDPTDAFLARVDDGLQAMRNAEAEGERISASNRWMDRLSYPLTVLAMAIVVLAFGHLLSTKPTLEDAVVQGSGPTVNRSLLIIGTFSALDLVWTIMATSAGTMRELNPLGSRLIEDPLLLVAFKLVATGTSIGILYSLQQRPIARVASWWCCLLLTLLTARWVVFQSMFA
ncbi:MAG: DUF5658 family protein [Planctomycetota bacterium]